MRFASECVCVSRYIKIERWRVLRVILNTNVRNLAKVHFYVSRPNALSRMVYVWHCTHITINGVSCIFFLLSCSFSLLLLLFFGRSCSASFHLILALPCCLYALVDIFFLSLSVDLFSFFFPFESDS